MVSHVLQTVYIRMLNPIYRITGKMSDKARNTVIQVLCFYFPIYMIIFYSKVELELSWTHFQTHLVGSIVILLIAIFSIDRPLDYVSWNKILTVPFFLSGIGLIITGFIHPTGDGYRLFGFMLVFIYPCFYFVWNNRGDYQHLFYRLSIAITVVGLIWFVCCFIMACKGHLTLETNGRVRGIADNANLFGFPGIPEFCAGRSLLVAWGDNIG